MPRRRGAAVRDMGVHDGRAGDSPTVEQPVPRLGVGERAELSRQALVGGPGDRRHDAHETVGASCIPKVGRPELGLGPITGFIEHVRSLARPPGAAGSARDMRSLAHKRKMWVTVRVIPHLGDATYPKAWFKSLSSVSVALLERKSDTDICKKGNDGNALLPSLTLARNTTMATHPYPQT